MSTPTGSPPYGYDPENGRPLDSEAELRRQARERVEAKAAFRTHLFAFIVINAMLIGAWAFTDQGFFWPVFPLIGWGVGLLFHWRSSYGDPGVTEAQIQAEMDRLRKP